MSFFRDLLSLQGFPTEPLFRPTTAPTPAAPSHDRIPAGQQAPPKAGLRPAARTEPEPV